MREDKSNFKYSPKKIARLEAKYALFYALKTLQIRSAINKTDSSWDAYMAYLGEIMSKAY